VQLSSIDLNLLLRLDALLAERSVTLAGRRMALSPSAMSHALGRLRETFGDPLLIRSGRGMMLTPLGEDLRERVHTAIDHVRRALEPTTGFDPAISTRSFRISCADGLQVVLLPSLLRQLTRVAPGVSLETLSPRRSAQASEALERGDFDLAIGQFSRTPPAIRQERLFESRLVCLVRRDHPRIRRRLTLQDYLDEGHLVISPAFEIDFPLDLDGILEKRGMRRRVVARVGSFGVAPLVVAQTDFICTTAERVIVPLVALPLRIFDHPMGLPVQSIYLYWHERVHEQAAHRWFRRMLLDAADRSQSGGRRMRRAKGSPGAPDAFVIRRGSHAAGT